MKKLALILTLASLSAGAHANNGYFAAGFGITAKGMGGAATALALDAYGGANNPAAFAWIPDQMEIGGELILPTRRARFTNTDGIFEGEAKSKKDVFFAPEFAASRRLNASLSAGLTVYPSGGGNAHFPDGQLANVSPGCADFNGATGATGPFNLLCGTGSLGVSLEQLVVAPALAYQLNAQHALGIAPLFGVQRFRLIGRQTIDNAVFSNTPGKVTNNDYEFSFGVGVRVGYQGQLTPTLRAGAAWASKMQFEKFDDYRGLLARDGEIDIAENWNVGVAWQARPDLTIALDYQRLLYSDTPSVANPSANILRCLFEANRDFCTGGAQAPGLGWNDVGVWKLGVAWQMNDALTLRAGASTGGNPVPDSDVTINIVAPAITEHHVTLGATYRFASGSALVVSYLRALPNSLTGRSAYNDLYPLNGVDTISLNIHNLGVAWRMPL